MKTNKQIGWVSVGDRLPAPLETVWISNGKGWTTLGCLYFTDEGLMWGATNGVIYQEQNQIVSECEADDLDVQYWHPLPTAIKGEKIIFLDFDGVLNPHIYMRAMLHLKESSSTSIRNADEYGQLFMRESCEALEKIIGATGAKIVVISSWRLQGELAIKKMWNKRNLSGEIIGITPSNDFLINRGDEIQKWIEDNNFIGNYVIIDDEDDFLDMQQPYLVRTNGEVGLTSSDVKKAIEILNRP